MHIFNHKYSYWILFGSLLIVYIIGMDNIIYGIDAKIYASISSEMSTSSNWLEVYSKGEDYLDKPPLLFWLSALSIKILGVFPFSYRLPSLLFTLLGVFSTYKLGTLLYNKKVGRVSSLIYFSSLAIVLANQDVRTDNILASSVVFALWQLIAYIRTNNWYYFLGGFLGVALAMLCKGPIGIMIPVLSIFTHSILTKQFNILLKWQWLLGIILTLIFISPMVWGLYTQFDSQMPDKTFHLASGKEVTNYSGLKFYFWDQSFGRVFGGNKEGWSNNSTIFFFTHTYLWSLIPWSILGILAFIYKIKINKKSSTKEWFLIGAITLPFIAFSLSSFKLPHYILPLIPFWSILIGVVLVKRNKLIHNNIIYYVQLVQSVLLLVVGSYILFFLFPGHYIVSTFFFLIFCFAIWYFLKNNTLLINKIVVNGVASITGLLLLFNMVYIPELSKYDHSKIAADIIKKHNVNEVYSNVVDAHALEFYTNNNNKLLYPHIDLKTLTNKNNCLWIDDYKLGKVKNKIPIKKIVPIKGKSLTTVSLEFLLAKDKDKFLSTQYLVFI